MQNRVSAVFTSKTEAEHVLTELRAMGVPDSHLSLIARHGDDHGMIDGKPVEDSTGNGMLAGAGLGAVLGLASAFIPGVGPFMAAGALAATIGTIGASAVAGAVVGGATGAIAGAMQKMGYSEEESRYYGTELERGSWFVAINLDGTNVSSMQAREVFARHQARFAPGVVV